VTATIALLGYAAALAVLGPRLLRRMAWTDRAPLLAVAVWQTAVASVLGATVLAGLALVVSGARASHGLSHLIDACQAILRAHYGGPEPVAAYAGLVVATGVTTWTVAHVMAALVTTRRQRRAHLRLLAIVARRRPDLDALVLEHDEPLAYCLPGRHRCVVLTTGALERLDGPQLAAVLAHERAHLHGRHDLALNIAAAIRRAFPRVPLFEQTHAEVTHLVELLADDAAARRHDRVTVAAALVTVAAGKVPAAALGAGSHNALLRVRRLLAPHRPLSRLARLAGGLGVALLIALPLALAANPAITAALEQHCHLPF
jgi:Zn-dependent protease with chaperone function